MTPSAVFRVPPNVALQEAHARERNLIDRTHLLAAAVEELQGKLTAAEARIAELEKAAEEEGE